MTQKAALLKLESLAELALVQQAPCLSLYQPTHRRRPRTSRTRSGSAALSRNWSFLFGKTMRPPRPDFCWNLLLPLPKTMPSGSTPRTDWPCGAGRFKDADSGHPLADDLLDDLLDDLVELVGRMDGRVFVVPTDSMPGRTGLAAIYRY